MRLVALAIAATLAFSSPALAGETHIIADEIHFSADGKVLNAVGDVEIFTAEQILRASRIDYEDGKITAAGPLSFTEDDGTVVIADYAELSEDFRVGVLKSVQMLLAERMQIAAAQIERTDGHFTLLDQAVITTCRICKPGDRPIWYFKSRRVVHNEEEQQIYLEGATFHIADLPIFYVPWMRLPDPTVDRSSGLLPPTFDISDDAGLGVRTPYYFTLGDHADLTLTPFLTTSGGFSLDFEHRHRFRSGWSDITGALTAGEPHSDEHIRGYLGIDSGWRFDNGYELSLRGLKATDATYLDEFDVTRNRRVESSATLFKRQDHSYFEAGTTHIESLGSQLDEQSDYLVSQANWQQRLPGSVMGGTVGLDFGVASFAPLDQNGAGRDVYRGSAVADWTQSWWLDGGLQLSATGALNATAYSDASGDNRQGAVSSLHPQAAADLRWPWLSSQDGSSYLLEPFVQLVWSPEEERMNLNLDGRLVEFDETNLTSLDRHSGLDQTEQGFRMNVGVRHTTVVPDEYGMEIIFGRVYRESDLGQFTEATGLSGTESDYVGSIHLDTEFGLGLGQRVVVGADADISKSETLFTYSVEPVDFSLGYSMVAKDADEQMSGDSNSVKVLADYDFGVNWTASTSLEYDFGDDAENTASFGISYKHHCFWVSALLAHDSPSSINMMSDTSISLRFSLAGLSASQSGSSQQCN